MSPAIICWICNRWLQNAMQPAMRQNVYQMFIRLLKKLRWIALRLKTVDCNVEIDVHQCKYVRFSPFRSTNVQFEGNSAKVETFSTDCVFSQRCLSHCNTPITKLHRFFFWIFAVGGWGDLLKQVKKRMATDMCLRTIHFLDSLHGIIFVVEILL